ncbi:hypothetical protein LTR10_006947 [Elasticomyces elasticus]|nr:hypothetical protein LTR10_006947 [Elasticomyces elasticus]
MLSTETLALCSSVVGLTLAVTNTTSAWPPYSPTAAPIFQLSADPSIAFYLEEALSLANWGGANSGEVLRIATQIIPQDFESVYKAFYYVAEQTYAFAESVDKTKDPVSAREAYYHAATYYRGADFYLHGNQSDPRLISLWNQQTVAFDKANALLEIPGERFVVQAHSEDIGDYQAIGVFYAAYPGHGPPIPTILVGGGYDSSQEEGYHLQCHQILSRGINCVTYEGPGMPTVRRTQNIGFVTDWWSATLPIVDYLATRPDVDMERLALVGISFGGILAPLAASHDDRFSAVISIDGWYSAQQDFEGLFPDEIVQLFNASEAEVFDEVMTSIVNNASYPSNFRWVIGQGLFAFNTLSPFEWFTRLGKMTVSPEIVANLSMPVFLAKGEDDDETGTQPEIAYEKLTTGRPNGVALTYLHQFNTSLGAGEHCSIGAESQLWAAVMGWLSPIWGDWAYANVRQ